MWRTTFRVAVVSSLAAGCSADVGRSADQAGLDPICGLPSIEAPATRPVDPCRDGTLVAGPHRFERHRGTPVDESVPFTVSGETQACIRLESGGCKMHRESSAWVKLDGERIVGAEIFDRNDNTIEKRVTLAAGDHVLSARLRGPPGTFVEASVYAGGGARHGLVSSAHLELYDLFADPSVFDGEMTPTQLTASGTVLDPPGKDDHDHHKGCSDHDGPGFVVQWRFEIRNVATCALVRTLRGETPVDSSRTFAPAATWDGHDDAGARLPGGTYAYRLVADLMQSSCGGSTLVDTLATPQQTVFLTPPGGGYVDFHTHPMSYLGFGEKAVHGAPDVGLTLPSGSLQCNASPVRAQSIDEALGSCNGTHGGWGLDNTCGDFLRAAIVNLAMDSDFAFKTGAIDSDHHHEGYPGLLYWPHQTSILHQQMWWEWLERAHQGGLRAIVALTVNNELLAEILNGTQPYDDRGVAERQIAEMVRMVGQHDFMEIAYSSADLARIVGEGKLAVVLGMEIDRIGNWKTLDLPSEQDIRDEVRHLHELGIRWVFPVHLVDNVFGGSAVYSPMFSFANKRANGYHFLVQTSSDPDVTYDCGKIKDIPIFGIGNATLTALHGLLLGLGGLPAPCADGFSCPPGTLSCCGSYRNIVDILSPSPELDVYQFIPPGHVNLLGLSGRGEIAIDEMMKLGMIIDIDHMSEKTMERVIEIAEGKRAVAGGVGYPLMFGHSGIRGPDSSERIPPRRLVTRVAALGGMMGAGTAHKTPDEFITSYRDSSSVMGQGSVGLGTDVDGFELLPTNSHDCKLNADIPGSTAFYARFLVESDVHTKSSTGNRTWDYVLDCGVSHYGLMPEWLFDVKAFHDGADVHDNLMKSAASFVRMWKQVEDVSAQLE